MTAQKIGVHFGDCAMKASATLECCGRNQCQYWAVNLCGSFILGSHGLVFLNAKSYRGHFHFHSHVVSIVFFLCAFVVIVCVKFRRHRVCEVLAKKP